MTVIRRIALVIGLTVAVIAGASIPASATFAESVKIPTTSITTPTVLAATNLRVTISCDYWNMNATVTWTRSTSARVSGYQVTAQFGADQVVLPAGANASRLTYSTSRMWAAHQVPVTITTLTDYGWTKTSAPVTVTTC
jgi:hypothetical protein